MDAKDLELLEFPRIREMVAGYCSFQLSRDAALKIVPSADADTVKIWLEECREARMLLEAEPSIGVDGLEDISDNVMAAARGKILDPAGLAVINHSLGILRLLRIALVKHVSDIPRLGVAGEDIGIFTHIENAISRAVSPDGELLPNASEKLAAIRNNQRVRKAELVNSLQSFISADTQKRYIQEPIITEREGRFVIAVKNESRNEIKGIVHDVSNSGATLFVEPWQTLEMGNAIKELQIAEAREIERILGEISSEIGSMSAEIINALEKAAFIDLALAKARFARRWHAVEAEIYKPDEGQPALIHLEQARHPLLRDTAVPLDLDLGLNYRILLITGPNTGGKTVALKTVGLLCLMTQAGMPIPASPGSRVPVLDGIYADIGDEQSIQGTLSTFGWHMSNISRILRCAGKNSLILLDELGASTDPQEGAALGRAVLTYLLEHGMLAMVTTHYNELKLFAHVTGGLQNAAFDFDPQTLTPNYHLILGTPGGSNAIATAEHFGLPGEVISLARQSLDPDAKRMESLLVDLETEKQRLNKLNAELEHERQQYASQNREMAEELATFKKEKRQIIIQARDSVVAEIAQLEKEIKQASRDLRKEHSQATVAAGKTALHRIREHINSEKWKPEDAVPDRVEDKISVGDSVWLKAYGTAGKILEVNYDSGQVEVIAGAVRFRMRLDEVTRMVDADKAVKKETVHVYTEERAPLEIDLRGRRAEEIEVLLDRYLNDAALSNLKQVRVIHGFGTGVVRSIVREICSTHPLVKSFQSAAAAEGGDGATLIQLK